MLSRAVALVARDVLTGYFFLVKHCKHHRPLKARKIGIGN